MSMEIISFDANKEVWNEFLIKQPEEHPDFFKIPQTFQGQVYFTTILELIAKRSMSFDSVQGLWSFFPNFCSVGRKQFSRSSVYLKMGKKVFEEHGLHPPSPAR